nr:hypothetical protein [Tanacetum cinerariifolium]
TTFRNWNLLVCPRELVWRILETIVDKFMIRFGVNVSLDSRFPLNVITRFATVVENASGATTKDVLSACQATALPAEEEKNTNPTTIDAEPNLHDELVNLLGIDVVT